MKRCTFHVPSHVVRVLTVLAVDEADAWAKLDAGEYEEFKTFEGNTKSGSPELVACIDINERKRRHRHEQI